MTIFTATINKRVLNKCNPSNVRLYLIFSSLIIVQTACKKLVDTPIPTDQIAENAVYSNNATAISVLTGIYASMNTEPIQGSLSNGSISLFAGLAADEYKLADGVTAGNYLAYYQNSLNQLNASPVAGHEHWASLYKFIFRSNAAIEGLNSTNANDLLPAIRQQLLGEAKFIRAFFYFYLINEFENVPLVLTTDAQITTLLPKESKDQVYQQIISDLIDAEEKLSGDFLDPTLLNPTSERVRPTKWAATALLARTYLYLEKYQQAEEKTTALINQSSSFTLLPVLNNVFLKNSKEAIWQIQPTSVGFNTVEARTLVIPPTGPSTGGALTNPVILSRFLLSNFEAGDKRAIYGNWIDTVIYQLTPTKRDTVTHPYKYKVNNSPAVTTVNGLTEYFMILRLAEQYLIRAEARAKLGNIGGAQADLNAIRNRAGLVNTSATDKDVLLTGILRERQVELFSEWGHRWFDLKRAGRVDAVMSIVTPQKTNGSPWRPYQKLFPIPLDVLSSSPNLTQNDGY